MPAIALLKKLSPVSSATASMKTMRPTRSGICCSSSCIHTPARECPTSVTFFRLLSVITCASAHQSQNQLLDASYVL